MPKHFMTNQSNPIQDITVEEIQSRYRKMTSQLKEGLEVPLVGGGPEVGGGPGVVMPPPAIVPPLAPAGGVPGAAGDAALQAPPEIKTFPPAEKKPVEPVVQNPQGTSPGSKKEAKGIRRLLKAVRENLLEIEIKLRETGALDGDDEED